MEGIQKQETKGVRIDSLEGNESTEMSESIERARGLRDQLEIFRGTEIVGSDDLHEVEDIAHALGVELEKISAKLCMENGLPYHPTDLKVK